MKQWLVIFVLLSSLMALAFAFSSPEERGLVREGDNVVLIGDSITEQGFGYPWGYYHVLTNEAASSKELAALKLNFIPLGFSGYQVNNWHDMLLDSATNTNRWTWYRNPGWNLKEVFDGKVDVVVILLGANDILEPSMRANAEDIEKWAESYRRFVESIRERCRPRQFVFVTITPITADETSPKNRVRELMNNRLRAIAADAEDVVVADAGGALAFVQDELYACDRNEHIAPDFVHPDAAGHSVLAGQILDALELGECHDAIRTFCARFDRVVERNEGRIELSIEPIRTCGPDDEKASWIVHYAIPNDDAVEVETRMVVPEGWTVDEPFQVTGNGNFIVCGRPDRALNEVKLVATMPDGTVRERTYGIPASWRLSEDGGAWKRYTAQDTYTGGATPGSIDPYACFFGWKTNTLVAARRVWSEKDRDVKAVLSHQGFSETLDLAVALDGKEVWKDNLDRNGRNRLEKTLRLHKGWNALEITCVHRHWQRQFSFDLEPIGDDDLSRLRYDIKGGDAQAEEKPVLIFNEDSDNVMRPFWHRDAARYTEREIREYVHRVIDGGHVTHFFACVNARVSAYPSKVAPNYWAALGLPGYERPQWLKAMKDLVVDQGVDQFKVYVDECRAKGVSPWLSFRMNDIHFPNDPERFLNVGFWKEHPELWNDPATSNRNDCAWGDKAFDYRKKGVQDHMLAYIAEALDRYDVDGIELDWMRFEHHCPRSVARTEGMAAISAFMRKVRSLADAQAKRRGHPVLIAGRVDTEPEAALNHGTDYRTWAKEGLVDWLIVCNFWRTVDFELPFAKWAEELKAVNPGVKVYPGLDCGVEISGKPRRFLTADEYAGWADRMYAQGARGVYVFNLFCNPADAGNPGWESWDYVLGGGLTPEGVAGHAKSVPDGAPRECVQSGWYRPESAAQ